LNDSDARSTSNEKPQGAGRRGAGSAQPGADNPAHGSGDANPSGRRGSEMALGNMAIPKVLTRLAVPATVGMMVNALYNLVDAIFVGQAIGPMGIAGLTIAFPIQMIILACAQLLGMGAASIVSRSLGAGDRETARATAGTALGSAVIVGVMILVTGEALIHGLLRAFGATEEILPFAYDYVWIIFLGTPFVLTGMTGNNLLRSEGKAGLSMTTMLIGTGLNIILDPVLIFGFGMGIQGAAIATVTSRFASFVFLVFVYASGRSSLELRFHHLKPRFSRLTRIAAIGLPAFVRQGSTSVMVAILNNVLGLYGGSIYVSVFGSINRLMMFTMMPIFGVGQAFQPIAGYNYGAKSYDRVRHVIRLSMLVTVIVASTGALAMHLFPHALLGMFVRGDALTDAGVAPLRVVILTVPIVGIQVIGSTYFLAIGRALPALVLGMSRQVLLLIPLMLILPMIVGLPGVWWAFPLADLTSTLLTVGLLIRQLRCMPKTAAADVTVARV
jgi:putative MATE family efflux protein